MSIDPAGTPAALAVVMRGSTRPSLLVAMLALAGLAAFVTGCSADVEGSGGGTGIPPGVPPGSPPPFPGAPPAAPTPAPPPSAVATEVLGPGASPDAPARFAGAPAAGVAPSILYPADGALVPPNLVDLELQWLAGAGNTQFEITFWNTSLTTRVYVGCNAVGAGCSYAPDDAVWSAITGASRGREAVSYQVRGMNVATGAAGATPVQTLDVADDDVVGGIYYWNAAAGSVMRYDFGLRGQRAETFLDRARTGAAECVGCHALSRDGSRIAVGIDEPIPSRVAIYDVATRRELFSVASAQGANFFSFSPDSANLVVSDGAGIRVLDSLTGTSVAAMAGVSGSMPDWSPDGTRIVFAEQGAGSCTLDPWAVEEEEWDEIPCVFPSVQSAQISVLENVGGTWRRGPVLVPSSGDNNFYPSFSPDGQWVLFNRSASNAQSYDSEADEGAPRDHELWVVSVAGGAPIRLDRARSGVGEAWPKWDPTPHSYRGQPLFWLSFASIRPYGLRSPTGGLSQIWIAGFVPSRAGTGLDPVTPPVWLPFQDPASGNHIAQWVSRVERQGCVDASECAGGELCDAGRCVPDLI